MTTPSISSNRISKPRPHPMRLTERDKKLIQKIYAFDGILARRQIKQLFFPNAHQKAMERRISILRQNGYLKIPSLEQRRNYPIAEPIVWLGWRGILQIAYRTGVEVPLLTKANENQFRRLEKVLREQDIHWQRTPRWSQLAHDIATNDIRLAVEHATFYYPQLALETWIPEGVFSREMDTIQVHGRKKGVRPDGFFTLVNHGHLIQHHSAKARFLLEYDNSTHPTTRFGRDKALPGYLYIKSEFYKKRFGYNSGRWLVVCKSQARMQHLKQKTELVVGKNASVFYFSTLDQITPKSFFFTPIWKQGGKQDLVPLIHTF